MEETVEREYKALIDLAHIDITRTSVVTGLASTLLVLLITVYYQKRFDTSDIGSFIAAFFSGSNLPPAVFLAMYLFADDPNLSQTLLKGYEKYISGAGLALFLVSLVAIWKLCATAWEVNTEKKKVTVGAEEQTMESAKGDGITH